MQQCHNEPAAFFDSYQWGRIYESCSNEGFIFRRGAILAEEACLRYITTGSLLIDVGCGTGHLSNSLSQKGYSVIGVDHDPKMIAYARERFSTGGKEIVFLIAKAELLPFGDNSFDGIEAVSLMGCISSPEKVLREFHRVLRKGGIAIITFTNSDSLLLKLNSYLNLVFQKKQDENVRVRYYSYKDVKENVLAAGFRILEIRYYNFFLNIRNHIFPSKRLSVYMERFKVNKLMGKIGRNFLIVLEKL